MESDLDNISLTSTIEDVNDPDQEFELVEILAEREVGGKTLYLVLWKDFPLAQATWEPRDHFQEETVEIWESYKNQSGERTIAGFKVSQWIDAVHSDVRARKERHDARNRKRLSLGQSKTAFHYQLPLNFKAIEQSIDDDESFDDMTVLEMLRWANQKRATQSYSQSLHTNNDAATAIPADEDDDDEEKAHLPNLDFHVPSKTRSSASGAPYHDENANTGNHVNSSPRASEPPLTISETDLSDLFAEAPPSLPDLSSASLFLPDNPALDQGLESETAPVSLVATDNTHQPASVEAIERSTSAEVIERHASAEIIQRSASVEVIERPASVEVIEPLASVDVLEQPSDNALPPPGRVTPIVPPSNTIAPASTVPSRGEDPKRPRSSAKSAPTPSSSRAGIGNETRRRGDNVFIGGKVRKEASTLLDAITDKARKPKFFNPHRRNLVQKRLRDREGIVAPSFPPVELISLDKTAPGVFSNRPVASSGLEASVPQATEDIPSTVSNPTANGSSVEGAQAITDAGQQADERETFAINPDSATASKKRKKSVHWDDNVINKEPKTSHSKTDGWTGQAVFESTLSEDGSVQTGPLTTLKPVLSIGNCRGQGTLALTKACTMGPEKSRSIMLEFLGLPDDDSDLPWFQNFRARKNIAFTHSCTAHDFMAQLDLRAGQLAEGPISAKTDPNKLEAAAAQLRLGVLGLLCHCEEYCVLLFPPEAGHWKDVFVRWTPTLADYLLCYAIFKPSASFDSSMLSPISLPPKLLSGHEEGADSVKSTFRLFFNIEYNALLPSNIKQVVKHYFFLVFPPSCRHEASFLSHWLRYANPESEIRTSLLSGSWLSFLKSSRGIVIIHEEAIWSIRTLPSLNYLLDASCGNYSFWIFRRSSSASMLKGFENNAPSPGGLSLCPVFPHGTVFLLTPSFLVSQPEQAYVFLKWFWKSFSRSSSQYHRGRLAVSSDIDDWMFDLALEKLQLQSSLSGQPSELFPRIGLTDRAIESRFKAWEFLRKMATESREFETEGLLVMAPDPIDGNDDQSLVNWFGWWSIANMAYFRKFVVLGPGNVGKARLRRTIKAAAYLRLSETEAATDSAEGREAEVEDDAPKSMVSDDESALIRSQIARAEASTWKADFCPLLLYKFPVSYWHSEMPWYFGDFKSTFHLYSTWFRFFTGHLSKRLPAVKRPNVNTFAGFFYTIEGEWDGGRKAANRSKATRRPWVAIFRPKNLHKRPWHASELLIWDWVAMKKKLEGEVLYESNLIGAQQELIYHVQRESREVLNIALEDVWLGGFTDQQHEPYSTALDITLRWLQDLPFNVRNWLPVAQAYLPPQGWEPVRPGKDPGGSVMERAKEVIDGGPTAEASSNRKAVFSPPLFRGKGPRASLGNRLWEWAQRIREKGNDRGSDTSKFVFVPTAKWYEEQVKVGRGYHQMRVTTWDSISARYQIPDPEKAV